MDILFRLETVAETTIGGHPEATIMYEYAEAAKEIRKLREQLAETVNYAFILRAMVDTENANGMFNDALNMELPPAMKEAAWIFADKLRNQNDA